MHEELSGLPGFTRETAASSLQRWWNRTSTSALNASTVEKTPEALTDPGQQQFDLFRSYAPLPSGITNEPGSLHPTHVAAEK